MKNRFLHMVSWILKGTFLTILFMGSLIHQLGNATLTERYADQKLDFSVQFKNESNPYSVSAVFVLPGDMISFKAVGNSGENNNFVFESQKGDTIETLPNAWTWRAPAKPGITSLRITEPLRNQTMTLNVFVMVPFHKMKKGMLGEYRIGDYPKEAKINSILYQHPEGFIEVTPQNKDTLVSPHFTLGQFLCKQEGSYPKYVVLRERLLYQLENVLSQVNQYGLRCPTLTIMSGYRTPYYNRSIHNVAYSRHLWGDAADIYIDFDPSNGMMDDLNRDGKVDIKDGLVLRQLVLNLIHDPMYHQFVGGLGVYETNNQHGPFVHLDVRGVPANW